MNYSIPALTAAHPAWTLVLQYRKIRDTIDSQTRLRERAEARLVWLRTHDRGNLRSIKLAADKATDIQDAIRQLWRQAECLFEEVERVHREAGFKDVLTSSRLLSR